MCHLQHPQVDGSGLRSFTTKLEYLFWPSIENYTQTLETFSIRFSWETANLRMSREHGRVSSLQFTFKRLEGLLAVGDLRQGFLPLKIAQPHV